MERVMVYRFGDEHFNGAGDADTGGMWVVSSLLSRCCYDIPGPSQDGLDHIKQTEVCAMTFDQLTRAAQSWLEHIERGYDCEEQDPQDPDEATEILMPACLWALDVPADHVRIGRHQVLVNLEICAEAYHPRNW